LRLILGWSGRVVAPVWPVTILMLWAIMVRVRLRSIRCRIARIVVIVVVVVVVVVAARTVRSSFILG